MLKYVDRRGTNCSKWDALESMYGDKDLLSMWVADMDFEIAEPIRAAVRNYVDNVPWGYYNPGPGYKEAFIEWERKYHGYEVKPEWICFSSGIVSASQTSRSTESAVNPSRSCGMASAALIRLTMIDELPVDSQ